MSWWCYCFLLGVQSCGGQYAQCTGMDSNTLDSIVVFRNKPKAKQPASGSPSSFGKCHFLVSSSQIVKGLVRNKQFKYRISCFLFKHHEESGHLNTRMSSLKDLFSSSAQARNCPAPCSPNALQDSSGREQLRLEKLRDQSVQFSPQWKLYRWSLSPISNLWLKANLVYKLQSTQTKLRCPAGSGNIISMEPRFFQNWTACLRGRAWRAPGALAQPCDAVCL